MSYYYKRSIKPRKTYSPENQKLKPNQECEWESIIINTRSQIITYYPPTFFFSVATVHVRCVSLTTSRSEKKKNGRRTTHVPHHCKPLCFYTCTALSRRRPSCIMPSSPGLLDYSLLCSLLLERCITPVTELTRENPSDPWLSFSSGLNYVY